LDVEREGWLRVTNAQPRMQIGEFTSEEGVEVG